MNFHKFYRFSFLKSTSLGVDFLFITIINFYPLCFNPIALFIFVFKLNLKTKFIMGLDTSHNCWHAPYLSFDRFRYSLAHQIGIDLDDYDGYGETGIKDLTKIENELMPLFNHSDRDGILTVEESKKIVIGLNKILENFNDKIKADCNFKEQIIQFRDGCLNAIERNEEVDFH